VGCALAANALAHQTGVCSPDDAFLAGLMHDIGRLGLLRFYRYEYEKMLKRLLDEEKSHSVLLKWEKESFGVTHAEIELESGR